MPHVDTVASPAITVFAMVATFLVVIVVVVVVVVVTVTRRLSLKVGQSANGRSCYWSP
jgi:hypothetical protein